MRRQARLHWQGQSMARKTYGPATCLQTTSPLYPLAPLSSPRLFFPLKSPQPLLSPTLLPPLSIPCWVVYNPKTFFPVSHNKSHSDPPSQSASWPCRVSPFYSSSVCHPGPRGWYPQWQPWQEPGRGLLSPMRLLGFPRLPPCLRASLCARRQAF